MKGKPGHKTSLNEEGAEPRYRMRRGKKVQIPQEWVGHTTHKQTIRKRQPVKRRTRKGP